MLIKYCSTLLIIFCIAGTLDGSLKATNPQSAIDWSQVPQTRIMQFQKKFESALKHPEHMEWIAKVYTDGFRNDIGYTEFGPSFVAYVALHQYLYMLMEGIIPSRFQILPEILKDFKAASKRFLSQISKLNNLTDVDMYEGQLHELYKDFLVNFINKHENFFKVRFTHNLSDRLSVTEMDPLDCAFFALQKGWPSFESNNQKYQFEQLYAYPCEDGRTLILGYNRREHTCERNLQIYLWNTKEPDNAPIQIMQPNMKFDLSPEMSEGGCSYLADVPNVINFADGRFLRFYGYEHSVFRYYIYDVISNKWDITEIGPLMTP
jgi:hypothetical protein